MDAVAAIARTSISLVAVLGLLYLISRWLRRRQGVVAGGADFAVLAKQSLGAKAAVALVQVGDKALVVGVSDAGVSLLGETDVASVLGPAAIKGSAAPAEEEGVTAPAADDGTDPAEGVTPQPAAGERYVRRDGETIAVKSARHASSGVAGSALSPATWTKAVDVLRERTTRR
ncbi:flagellar protein FliO/FliZ [Kineococcus radiotolerans]|uniref:Flagellar protein FliO/FliZ n=1 Tax=Kineococcus radiotolerans TaxID=131568 RepID=A0A7W4TJC9_KINRA|nr:flagellar biosynthetic protein FliO [Kineococcus radiotolerans]MBB2899638.1 flagellar protein FliO/FliZ [Kineococcus radiotolerans]